MVNDHHPYQMAIIGNIPNIFSYQPIWIISRISDLFSHLNHFRLVAHLERLFPLPLSSGQALVSSLGEAMWDMDGVITGAISVLNMEWLRVEAWWIFWKFCATFSSVPLVPLVPLVRRACPFSRSCPALRCYGQWISTGCTAYPRRSSKHVIAFTVSQISKEVHAGSQTVHDCWVTVVIPIRFNKNIPELEAMLWEGLTCEEVQHGTDGRSLAKDPEVLVKGWLAGKPWQAMASHGKPPIVFPSILRYPSKLSFSNWKGGPKMSQVSRVNLSLVFAGGRSAFLTKEAEMEFLSQNKAS